MRVNNVNNNNQSFGIFKVPELSTLPEKGKRAVEEVFERFNPIPVLGLDDRRVMLFRYFYHERTAGEMLKEGSVTYAKMEDRLLEDPAMRDVFVNRINVINGNPSVQISKMQSSDVAIKNLIDNHIKVFV